MTNQCADFSDTKRPKYFALDLEMWRAKDAEKLILDEIDDQPKELPGMHVPVVLVGTSNRDCQFMTIAQAAKALESRLVSINITSHWSWEHPGNGFAIFERIDE